MKTKTSIVLLTLLLIITSLGQLHVNAACDAFPEDVMNSSSIEGENTKARSGLSVPYKTIALQADSTGCYLSCDVGAKDPGGRFSKMDAPDLYVDATQISENEMFELVPCSDGSYALRSVVNRQFITYAGIAIWRKLKCDADFVNENEELTLVPEESGIIKLKNYDRWLYVDDGKLSATTDSYRAEVFNQIIVDDNHYTDEELRILSSDEWFNIDHKENGGLYCIQYDIGQNIQNNAITLKDLDYIVMNLEDQVDKHDYVAIDKMQCFVAYKEADGFVDIIIAFHGTNGYGLVDQLSDIIFNLKGFRKTDAENLHVGYHEMAGKLIRNENKIVDPLGGVSLHDLVLKAIEGKARFTILGFSMGGAIAQCYALYLSDIGIPKSQIKGRTFNSTLACSFDDEEFTDWYNICVSTDSVCNGLIPGSLLPYGIHGIGKTIWLYDHEPEINHPKAFSNISVNKHYLQESLYTMLKGFAVN